MNNTPSSPSDSGDIQDVLDIEPTRLIYADKVISGGFGPQVSRIQLGMERANGKVAPSECIILPTASIVSLITSALPALKDPNFIAQLRLHVTKFESDISGIELKNSTD